MNLDTVFNFIKEKRGYKVPLRYKLIEGLPLTEDDLNVEGDLDISETNITSLPDNLTVGEDLNASFSKMKKIPNNLTVGGDLYLLKTPLYVKYDDKDIRKLIEDKGGYVKRRIWI